MEELTARLSLKCYMGAIGRRAVELKIELDAPTENWRRITKDELRRYCEHVQATVREDAGTPQDKPLPHDHHSLWDDAWCAGQTLGLNIGGVLV